MGFRVGVWGPHKTRPPTPPIQAQIRESGKAAAEPALDKAQTPAASYPKSCKPGGFWQTLDIITYTILGVPYYE